jgi:hypothetical protein
MRVVNTASTWVGDTLLSPKDSLLSATWEENESRFGCLDSTVLNLKSLMGKFYVSNPGSWWKLMNQSNAAFSNFRPVPGCSTHVWSHWTHPGEVMSPEFQYVNMDSLKNILHNSVWCRILELAHADCFDGRVTPSGITPSPPLHIGEETPWTLITNG